MTQHNEKLDLLATKLQRPPIRPRTTPRNRLIERVNQHDTAALFLISAPAGYGKTTLLADWSRQTSSAVSWLTLDEDDNDFNRFLTYLASAVQVMQPDAGGHALGLLRLPLAADAAEVLTSLINDLSHSVEPRTLILDDYHAITEESVHQAVTFLLDHAPANFRLIIATRADPPLPIARLRGRGLLVEIRQAELCFTPDEAADFLNQIMNLDLSLEDVGTLTRRTEGWIAGLQLAAVSIQGLAAAEDASAFVDRFAGSSRYVLDYLMEEVLARQPAPIQNFLLRTSILDRLTAALCDAVTQQSTGQETLEWLERTNLFIVPLDDHRQWYRYHRLFSDLLRERLSRERTEEAAILHQRASRWYEISGQIPSAVDHAFDAGDFQRAAQLIEQIGDEMLMLSRIAALSRWLEQLPESQMRARPALQLYAAWAMMFSSHQNAEHVEKVLAGAAGGTAPPDTPDPTTLIKAFLAFFQGDLDRSLDLFQQVVDQAPVDTPFYHSAASLGLGVAHLLEGDIKNSSATFEQAAEVGLRAGNLMSSVIALINLAKLQQKQGQLGQAEQTLERALGLAVDDQGEQLPVAGAVLVGLGSLYLERNQLSAAGGCFQKGVDLLRPWGEFRAVDGYIGMVRVAQALGDKAAAAQAFDEASRVALRSRITVMDDLQLSLFQAKQWIMQGELEAAASWLAGQSASRLFPAAENGEPQKWIVDRISKYEQILLARLRIAQGRPDEAIPIIEQRLGPAAEDGRVDLLIELHLLKALALQQQGSVAAAISSLKHALALAEPEGHIRIFVDEGEAVMRLLYQASAQGIFPQFAGRVLSALTQPETSPQPADASPPLMEPLSSRELEVLALIAQGLSNREVALQLYLSPSTIKAHTRNIYQKLNVGSRTQAVAIARSLQLL